MASVAILPALHELSSHSLEGNGLESTIESRQPGPSRSTPLKRKADDLKPSISDTGILRCNYEGCGKTFVKFCKYEDHVRSHTGERPFCCDYPGCEKSFRRKDHLQRHVKSHPQKDDLQEEDSVRPFQCTLRITGTTSGSVQCSKRFMTRQHLIRHIRGVHDYSTSCDELSTYEEAEKEVLGQDSSEKTKKRKRVRRPGEYACTIAGCLETFTKRKLLRSHINVYHSDKAKVLGNVNEEEAAKIARLPFPCTEEGCEKRHATNSKRNAHIQEKHKQTKGLPYICTHEDHTNEVSKDIMYRFATWSELQTHQREKHKSICKQCNKSFKDAHNLRVHSRRYHAQHDEGMSTSMLMGIDKSTMEKNALYPFVCGELLEKDGNRCIQRFFSKYNRDLHVRTVHQGEKPFGCPHERCQRQFTSKRAALRHSYKCVFANQSNENDADLSSNEITEGSEEDFDDDFFRREGGAVPESNADRPKQQKRKIEDNSMSKASDGNVIKKRKIRGRILSCPWPKICRMRDGEEEEVAGRMMEGEENRNYTCSFRFSRLYDVQRHLSRQHDLSIAQTDLRSLLNEKEISALGKPRKGTQIAIEEEKEKDMNEDDDDDEGEED